MCLILSLKIEELTTSEVDRTRLPLQQQKKCPLGKGSSPQIKCKTCFWYFLLWIVKSNSMRAGRFFVYFFASGTLS